jgi:hypothetical protein
VDDWTEEDRRLFTWLWIDAHAESPLPDDFKDRTRRLLMIVKEKMGAP